MSSNVDVLLDEQKFPCIGMTKDERNYCLNIIRNCRDLCDTENKVDGINKCEIVEMHFRKDNNVIRFSGSLSIGNEFRTIEGYLYIEKDRILVDYKINRLCIETDKKEYTVLDEFKIENGVLKRRSQYNYNMESLYAEVDDEILKGRLR